MEYTFRGISSSLMGVTVMSQPQLKSAEKRMTFIDIDGRDGSLTYDSGYKHYSTEMTIAIEDITRLEDIRGWLTGEGQFTRSDIPNRYINVTINDTLDYTHLQFGIHTAVVTLNVYDPFWYEMPWLKNLIRSDFSDFTAFQGATVTKNKTFPIEVFKGGRNWARVTRTEFRRVSIHPYSGSLSRAGVMANPTYDFSEMGITATNNKISIGAYIEVEGIKETGFRIDATRLDNTTQNNAYTVNTIRTNKGELRQVITVDTTLHKSISIYLSPIEYTEPYYADVKEFKVATTNNPNEPYSPAPEDGYDYTGEDGAWHIQTSGGANNLKCLRNTGVSKLDVTYQNKVNIVAWENMRVGNNFSSATRIPLKLNELNEIAQVSKGNGTTLLFMTFQTLKPSDPLDFIASDPSITDGTTTDQRLVTTEIVNQGNTPSKPIIKITRFTSNSAELRMTVGNRQMIYTWPQGEQYVEYDNRTGYSFYEGQRRDRHWHIDMEPFTLNPGSTKVVKEAAYTTEVHVKKESRWR